MGSRLVSRYPVHGLLYTQRWSALEQAASGGVRVFGVCIDVLGDGTPVVAHQS